MSDRMTCADVRSRAFEYRRDELGEPQRALVEAHAQGCSACARYLGNLTELLAEAAAGQPLAAAKADAMWAGIEARLPDAAAPRVAGTDAGDGKLRVEAEPSGDRDRPRRRRAGLVWAAAAIALLALATGLWLSLSRGSTDTDGPTQPVVVVEGADRTPTTTAPEAGDEKELNELASAVASEESEPELHRVASRPGVDVYAERDADWSLDNGDGELVVRLARGFVVIEVLPVAEGARRFIIEAPDRRVEVVGTVVLVTVTGGRSTVAVAAGSVRVTGSAGGAVVVEEGTELSEAGGVRPLAPVRRDLIADLVDLDVHRARLATPAVSAEPARVGPREVAVREVSGRARASERAAARERPPTTEPPAVGESVPEGPARLDPLSLAERAQREGRFGDAAAVLEALIGGGELDPSQRGLARLELARLYASRLGEPERAVVHLRRFIAEQPDDPAAGSAARELCRLAYELSLQLEECG